MTSADTLSVHIITVNEYYYIPKFLERVVATDTIDVVGMTTTPPSLGTASMLSFIRELYTTFGPVVFTKHALFYSKYRLLDLFSGVLGGEAVYSPKRLANRNDIDYRHTRDVNTEQYRSDLRAQPPDILVSVAATQQFEPALLAIPRERAINIHSSLLPEYRGVSPSFWTLLNDEAETGITVHEMDAHLDTGNRLTQAVVPIQEDETLHSLNTRVAERGGQVLLDALEAIRTGDDDPVPMDPDVGSYYSMPTRADVRAFRRQGNRFY